MSLFLGLDTSNYTTSAAVYDNETGVIFQQKKLLPVKENEIGLKQSDAVFHHVKQLPEMLETLGGMDSTKIAAVAASTRPRPEEGSYMPCFLVGEGCARSMASVLGVPFLPFSHQEGHIMAALYSAGALHLRNERFLAFHVSGGTTEALLVEPKEDGPFQIRRVAQSLDLKAGQAVDRVGRMLGLSFPAGPELDRLACRSSAKPKVRPTMKGADCCLSGIENQCKKLIADGKLPEDVALNCILSIREALRAMLLALLSQYGNLPALFAGGVMSNSIIRESFRHDYDALFAKKAFSSDNAAGIALLAAESRGML
ncbi:MAG: peptidase M22 [Clostridiales bacterium]|nr:peptidase M22 [Clostridiales bacterium]